MGILDEFFGQVINATTAPMDEGLRAHARATAEYVEEHAVTGPLPPSGPRTSGGYSSPGRGVSGESVN